MSELEEKIYGEELNGVKLIAKKENGSLVYDLQVADDEWLIEKDLVGRLLISIDDEGLKKQIEENIKKYCSENKLDLNESVLVLFSQELEKLGISSLKTVSDNIIYEYSNNLEQVAYQSNIREYAADNGFVKTYKNIDEVPEKKQYDEIINILNAAEINSEELTEEKEFLEEKISDLSDDFNNGLENCLDGFFEDNGCDYAREGYNEEGLKEIEKEYDNYKVNALDIIAIEPISIKQAFDAIPLQVRTELLYGEFNPINENYDIPFINAFIKLVIENCKKEDGNKYTEEEIKSFVLNECFKYTKAIQSHLEEYNPIFDNDDNMGTPGR